MPPFPHNQLIATIGHSQWRPEFSSTVYSVDDLATSYTAGYAGTAVLHGAYLIGQGSHAHAGHKRAPYSHTLQQRPSVALWPGPSVCAALSDHPMDDPAGITHPRASVALEHVVDQHPEAHAAVEHERVQLKVGALRLDWCQRSAWRLCEHREVFLGDKDLKDAAMGRGV
eukprot:364577-Chlamydomonas_euryale.AAC.15